MLFHLVEGDVLGEIADEAVDANAREATAPRGREKLLVLALAVAHERAEDKDARALRQRTDLIDDLLDRLGDDGNPVIRAVRYANAREEQTHVVVDLGDRADGRSRVARRSLLVDGYRRGKALDEVDVRLLHLTEELPRVGGERFDVAALALRIDRVESERRLPRSGQTGDDHHLVAGNANVDVLEVVLARAFDVDVIDRHQATVGGGGGSVRK